MTDTEAQPVDPSASQPTPAPIAAPVSELPEDARRAARDALAAWFARPQHVLMLGDYDEPGVICTCGERFPSLLAAETHREGLMAETALAAALPFLERATRDKIAAEIETHAGALVDVPGHSLPVREGVKVWPERQAGGYTQAIGEVLDLIGVARGGEATESDG